MRNLFIYPIKVISSIFVCSVIMMSCSQNQCQNNYDNYRKLVPNYMLVNYLGGKGKGLEYINKEKWREEGIYFNENNCLIQYVFFNTIINEARFIINYNEEGAIDNVFGKSMYLESNIFNDECIVEDKFDVKIHFATPPTHYSNFKIYQNYSKNKIICIDSGRAKENTNFLFQDYIQLGKDSTQQYMIINTLESKETNLLSYKDTVYFTVNKKHK